jgi:hypothetical protein
LRISPVDSAGCVSVNTPYVHGLFSRDVQVEFRIFLFHGLLISNLWLCKLRLRAAKTHVRPVLQLLTLKYCVSSYFNGSDTIILNMQRCRPKQEVEAPYGRAIWGRQMLLRESISTFWG